MGEVPSYHRTYTDNATMATNRWRVRGVGTYEVHNNILYP
jgi:hypothetical protein